MKCRAIAAVFLAILITPLFADSPDITWNLGTIDVAWNHMEPTGENTWSAQKMTLSLLDMQCTFPEYRLGLQTSLIQCRKNQDISSMFSLLPIEVSYNVLNSDLWMIGPYVRGEINLGDNRIYPYGEAGIKAGVLVLHDPNRLHYSWKCSVYVGYDSRNDINIGTQIDAGVFGLFLLWASSDHTKNPNQDTER